MGWQLFILESSQSDSTAFPSCLDTYATRLLTEPLRRSSCILRARNRPPTARGSLAREPERKLVDRTFRCIDEDFLFPGKMEYVGHEIIVPGGGTRIEWRPNQSRANCPHEPTHSIELVEE